MPSEKLTEINRTVFITISETIFLLCSHNIYIKTKCIINM